MKNPDNGRWFQCYGGDRWCRARAGCPEHAPWRDAGGCEGERFQIFNSANSGDIMNGQTVWLKQLRFSTWVQCSGSDNCLATAVCPADPAQRAVTEDTGCTGSRFQIFNSANSGVILYDQAIWLKHVHTNMWLECTKYYCKAISTCPDTHAPSDDSPCTDVRMMPYVGGGPTPAPSPTPAPTPAPAPPPTPAPTPAPTPTTALLMPEKEEGRAKRRRRRRRKRRRRRRRRREGGGGGAGGEAEVRESLSAHQVTPRGAKIIALRASRSEPESRPSPGGGARARR